jgi:hypothetical protein
MARIRSLHPGFFRDKAVLALSADCPLALLLLQGLWCEADDAGAFEWDPLILKAQWLPATSADGVELIGKLVQRKFIRRFEIDGSEIGVIRNFGKWQRPRKPEYKLPFTDETRAYAEIAAGAAQGGFKPDNCGTEAALSAPKAELGAQREEEEEEEENPPPPSPRADANARGREKRFAELTHANVTLLPTTDRLEAEARLLLGVCAPPLGSPFSPVSQLFAQEGATRADLAKGLGELVEKRFQPRDWGQVRNWIRAKMDDRIAAAMRKGGRARDGPAGADDTLAGASPRMRALAQALRREG